MACWGRLDKKEFEKLQKNLQTLSGPEVDKLMKECVNGLTVAFIRGVKQKTPVDTGALRGEWDFAAKAPITETHVGFQRVVTNSLEYASYVEYGHRTRGGKGWVEGRHMARDTANHVEAKAPEYLDLKVTKFIAKKFGGEK